jgi:mannose-6-phosphate isomerase-like protein (cupin superfamily)
MTHVIDRDELPYRGTAHTFEGYRYGDANVSFFLTDAPPGSGPKLHKHPYEEVFVIQEGELTFTVGDDIIEATSGQILVVPAGVPHKFDRRFPTSSTSCVVIARPRGGTTRRSRGPARSPSTSGRGASRWAN